MGKFVYYDKIEDPKKMVDDFEVVNEKGKQICSRIILRNYMPLPELVPGAEEYTVSILIKRQFVPYWFPTIEKVLDPDENSEVRQHLREIITEDVVKELLIEHQYYFLLQDCYRFRAQSSKDPEGVYSHGYSVMGVKLNKKGVPSWQERVGSKMGKKV
jgi:hypothetical protein